MKNNYIAIHNRLYNESINSLIRLCQLLLTKCFIVVVKTLDIDSAYRIFSVMNDRGLDLSATDILKSLITGEISEQDRKQEYYTQKWEDIEEQLGRDSFNALFSHIRMIEMRAKSRSNLVSDFKNHIKPNENPEKFIDEKLTPFSSSFSDILSRNFIGNESNEINKSLFWLNEIDNNDWMPAAIYYIAKYSNHSSRVSKFINMLEKVASIQMINRVAVNYRLVRYKEILDAVDNETEFDINSPLQLNSEEKERAKYLLNSDLYTQTRIRKMVLLRLDYELSDGSAIYNMPIISVEHVMPQKINEKSEWHSLCSDKELHKEWVHRLGNLTLLSRNKNSAASNYDFQKKKIAYFSSKGTASPFILTNQVLMEDNWTIDVIECRHKKLLETLYMVWNLI